MFGQAVAGDGAVLHAAGGTEQFHVVGGKGAHTFAAVFQKGEKVAVGFHGQTFTDALHGSTLEAGEDVDVVIETKRGHNLGRVIRSGSAVPNTGIPGIIGGYGKERVMHAQAEGILRNAASIGDIVEARAVIAEIETENGTVPVEASLSGLLRGLIRDGYPVTKGFKIADIDPRKEELQNCFTISDKARCIAGSVLEVICGELE